MYGWEPATTYTYDGELLVSSQPEVEWDDTEREWMLALDYYRDAMLCPRCGMLKSVCRAQATAANGAVVVEFERCHVTAAMLRKQKTVQASDESPESLMYSAGVKS